MKIAIRHAWLQKHPSPAAARGEFHWYPADGDRELRASFVERSRGVDAPAVLWQLAPGRASWARMFAATAPDDGRRYVGMVLATAGAERATPAELLEALEVPEAAPWRAEGEVAVAGGGMFGGRPVPEGEVAVARGGMFGGQPVPVGEIAAIARALLDGGDAVLAEPDRAELPRLAASVERWMPASAAGRTRAGVWRRGAAAQASDRVAGLIAAAWSDPESRAAQAWTLLCELAAANERSVDEIAGELVAADQPAAALTDAERAALGGARDFAATLHAWGRGRLDVVAGAATLTRRLADAVALRALVVGPRGIAAPEVHDG